MGKKKEILGIVSSLVVVALLLMTSPARAMTLGIQNDVSSVDAGEKISFEALVDLHREDLLLDTVNLTVELTNDAGQPNYTCTFDLEANKLTACTDFEIALLEKNTGSFDVGYGYAVTGSGTEQYGYGYGYGYAPGVGFDDFNEDITDSAEFIYQINWTSPVVFDETIYDMNIFAILPEGKQVMTDNTDDVTLLPAVQDSDDDGVPDSQDLCPATQIPEETLPTKALGVNRLVLTEDVRDENGYVYFMTSRPRNDMPLLSQFTTQDSDGCSCEQILEIRGIGPLGAMKYGCPRGYVEGGEYSIVARMPAGAWVFPGSG